MKYVAAPASVPSPWTEKNVSLTRSVAESRIERMFAPPARRPRRKRRRPRASQRYCTFRIAKTRSLEVCTHMAAPSAAGIRNVAFVGPHHSGKTTLVEAVLAHAGAIPRKGAVTDGTATTNHDSESIAHQMSVAPAFAHLAVGDVRV